MSARRDNVSLLTLQFSASCYNNTANTHHKQEGSELEERSNDADDVDHYGNDTTHDEECTSTDDGATGDEGVALVLHDSPDPNGQQNDAQDLHTSVQVQANARSYFNPTPCTQS